MARDEQALRLTVRRVVLAEARPQRAMDAKATSLETSPRSCCNAALLFPARKRLVERRPRIAGKHAMLLYNSIGPNPKVVRMFMAERGIELPRVEIDLRGGENRRQPYLSKNPSGQCPALELDNGKVLAEITAICEYRDEKYPGPSLIGATPEQRAETACGPGALTSTS